MRNKLTYFFVLLCTASLWGSCNRGELLSVRKQMEENIETAKRIEEMRKQLIIDFQNATDFYLAMERKLYVTDIVQNEDGSYVLVYSDGSEIRLQNGFTPFVEVTEEGEVIINHESTGLKRQDGEDGRVPEIYFDHEGYYWVDGVRTNVKGMVGEKGNSLAVSIDEDGFYCINGTRVQPEINLKGSDGTDGTAPVPDIVFNAAENRYELKINGASTAPPTFLSPEDGMSGIDGTDNGNYIQQVVLSENRELIFIFSDGSQQKSSPVSLSDLRFILESSKCDPIPVGESRTISFWVQTDYTTNQVSVFVYQPLKGWKVDIRQPDAETQEGAIVVTPDMGGLTESGVLYVKVQDLLGKSIVRRIELGIADYRIQLPELTDSYVYDVFSKNGYKIAEVCREYNQTAGKPLTVVYPYDEGFGLYGPGYVVENGGDVSHSGLYYIAGSQASASDLILKSGKIQAGTVAGQTTVCKPQKMVDIEGNEYKIAKIGKAYWTCENLKTEYYRNGQRIPVKGSPAANVLGAAAYTSYEGQAEYKDPYGVLYNGYAVKSGQLSPEGWRISTKRDWLDLIDYIGQANSGLKIKSEKMGNRIGAWQEGGVKGNNYTGFSALPGGTYQTAGGFQQAGNTGCWWTPECYYSLTNTDSQPLYKNWESEYFNSIRCVKDIVEDHDR